MLKITFYSQTLGMSRNAHFLIYPLRAAATWGPAHWDKRVWAHGGAHWEKRGWALKSCWVPKGSVH